MTEEAEQEATPAESLVKALLELGPAIDDALGRDDNEPGDIASLERLRAVLTFLGKRFDGADEQLLVDTFLESGLREVTAATTSVREYATTGDVAHLTAADQAMSRSLTEIARLVFPAASSELEGLRSAAKTYRSSLLRQAKGYTQQLGLIDQQAKSLGQQLKKLGVELRADASQLKEDLGGIRAELDSEKAAREESAEEELQALRVKLEAFEAEQTKAHAEAIEALGQERDTLVEKTSAAVDAQVKAWGDTIQATEANSQESIEKLVADFEERGRTMLTELESQLQKASELVGVIGDRAVTSGHKKAADEARGEVVFWHRVTFWSMVILILFAGSSAFGWLGKFDWPMFAGRVYFSVAVGVLAGYAASQASRYQQIERRNRKLELELKALEPFLQPVSPEQREQFRLKIAETFFGREEGGRESPGPTNAVQLLRSKEAMEALGEAIKTVVEKVKS